MDEINYISHDVFNKMIVIITDLVLLVNKDEAFMSIPHTHKGKGKI
jgi:hypothetical protein